MALRTVRDKFLCTTLEIPLLVVHYHRLAREINEEAKDKDKQFWMCFEAGALKKQFLCAKIFIIPLVTL